MSTDDAAVHAGDLQEFTGGMSTARAPAVSRRTTWACIGALAATLAVLTCAVEVGWGPLVAADVRIVLVARTAVAAHASAVVAAIAVTDVGSPVAVDGFTAVAVVVLLLRRRLRDASYVLLVRLVALGAENALKLGLARPRPDVVAPLTTAAGFSFPSGHTTGTTALCASLLVLLVPVLHRRGRAVAVAVAVLMSIAVAASRVLLGVHYPSDVAGGLLTGTLVAVLLAVVLPRGQVEAAAR
jgi:undecaprenyl-diphosphatase